MMLNTLRRVRAADNIQEVCWAALQQNTILGAPYRPSE